MPLEDMTGPNVFIDAFNVSWPLGSDTPTEGDDHIRGVKNCATNWALGYDESNLKDQVAVDIQAAVDAGIAAAILAASPPGSITPYAGETAPGGFLLCDGALYDTTIQADLFAAIGYIYGGVGNNFNVPDYRGQFLRGQDAGAGEDPNSGIRTDRGDGVTGDNVGTRQLDSLQNVTGNIGTFYRATVVADNGALFVTAFGGSGITTGVDGTNDRINYDTSRDLNARTSTETRGKNVYVQYLIKT